ncbi:MAG: RNA polymerase sigma factor [Anaerolineales bacterium]|nr:RNA polymerase sigma factor [Anaerolineales bacterium]
MPDWQEKTDQELVELAQKGNREAFAEIYNRYGEAIYRYLYGHVSNEQDAEDMTADVFLNLWRTLPQYQENKKVPFYVFLYRIARNRLVDYFRHQKTHDGEFDSPDIGEDTPAPRITPLIIAGRDVSDLHRYLLKLPPDYRTVLILRFLNDLSYEETAEVMGKSYGAVRVLQHRALAALRALMERGEA